MKNVFFIAVLTLMLGNVYCQDGVAVFESQKAIYQEDAKVNQTAFSIQLTEERIKEMEQLTSPMYEHIKFKHSKSESGLYDIIIYFKPEKDADYFIETLEMLGINKAMIGVGDLINLDQLKALIQK